MKRLTRVSLLVVLTVVFMLALCAIAGATVTQNVGMTDKSYTTYTTTDCRNCHGLNVADQHHATATAADPTKGCKYCHPTDATTGGMIIYRDCFANTACHTRANSPHHASDPAVAGTCTNCHDANLLDDLGTGFEVGIAPTYPPSNITPEPRSCGKCHDESLAAYPTAKANQGFHHEASQQCVFCHVGDPNLYDPTSMRQCESCHTMRTLHNIAGHVVSNATCTYCHNVTPTGTAPAYPDLPVLSSLSPTSGKTYSYVILTGNNFGTSTKKATVYFRKQGALDTYKAPASYVFPTEIKVAVPGTCAIGNWDVFVHTPAGDSAMATFTVTAPPALTGLNPTTGSPGTSVTLTGSGFSKGGVTVLFQNGGTNIPLTPNAGFTDSSATVTLPANILAGTYYVKVKTTVGISNAQTFTVGGVAPKLMSITPNLGIIGRSVYLTGSNLTLGKMPTVKFGTIAATVTTYNSTKVYCTVPSGVAKGKVNVICNNGSADSNPVVFTVQ